MIDLSAWLSQLRGIDGLGAPVIVACSGGADSLALLALAQQSGLHPIAVYVNHGLRAGTERDFESVKDLADSLGVPTFETHVNLEHGPNLEERARIARYDALEEARAQHDASAILVGHTADDQAETVLLNLLRGSGSAGLGGMAVRRDNLVRPLLGLRRADTEKICAELGVTPVQDSMNTDRNLRRVWVRCELLPLLEQTAKRDLVPVLCRQAELLRDESEFLDEFASSAWPDSDPPTAKTLAALPAVLARRAARKWIGSPPPSAAEVAAILEIAAGRRKAVELPGFRRVWRSGGRMYFEGSGEELG